MRRNSSTVESLQRFLPHGISKRISASRDRVNSTSTVSINASGSAEQLKQLRDGFEQNSSWKSVQRAIIAIFNNEAVSTVEKTLLCQNMVLICKSDIGPFIHDYYKRWLLERGMSMILQKCLASNKPHEKLINEWNLFYKECLPLLQTVFLPVVALANDLSFRDTTLVGFRDFVILQLTPLILSELTSNISEQETAALAQMCLVIQHVKEKYPGENAIKLEKITAQIVCPFYGNKGYYDGDKEPKLLVIRRYREVVLRKQRSSTNASNDSQDSTTGSGVPQRLMTGGLANSLTSINQNNTLQISTRPEPIARRHSVQFDLS